MQQVRRSYCTAIVYIATAAVPLVFARAVRDSFDITKALAVSVVGVLLLPFATQQWWEIIRGKRPSKLAVAGACFAVACVFVTIFSRNPWSSLWGQYQRYTGLLTLLSCAAIATIVARLLRTRDLHRLAVLLVSIQFVVNVYAWIQFEGKDPFSWGSDSFSRFVFSSLGNPNTASAFTVITLPLTVYLIGRFRISRYLAVGGATVFVTSVFFIPVYDSFQGNVGLIGTVLAIVWMIRSNAYEVGSYLIGTSLLGCIGVLLWFNESRLWLVICLLFVWFLLLFLLRVQGNVHHRRFPIRWKIFGPISGLLTVVVVGAMWSALRAGITDGLSERRFFYSAAWKLFKERPILGTGLDTFGFFYPQYRPEEHARSLEGSITSSVHSIPLGMFANGGLLLGLSFVLLMLAVLVRGLKRVVVDRSNADPLAPFATASFVAFLVISTVSVESIHLFFLTSLIIGMMAAIPDSGLGKPTKRAHKALGRRASSDVVLVGVSALLLAVTAPFLSRYFRADADFLKAARRSTDSNQSESLNLWRSATKLAPWEASYRAQYSQALAYFGDPGMGAEEALRAAKDSNYVSTMAPTLSRIVLGAGRFDEGFEILEKAIERDPFAPGVKLAAADLYRQVADYEVQQGLADAAARHRARADELTALAG